MPGEDMRSREDTEVVGRAIQELVDGTLKNMLLDSLRSDFQGDRNASPPALAELSRRVDARGVDAVLSQADPQARAAVLSAIESITGGRYRLADEGSPP